MTELTARDSMEIGAEALERRRERIFWYCSLALFLGWPFALHFSVSPNENSLRWQMPTGIQIFLAFLPGILLALLLEVFVCMMAGRRPRLWRKGLTVTANYPVPMPSSQCAGGILFRLQQQGFRAQASPDSRQIEFSKAKNSTVSGFDSHAFSGQAELTPEGAETSIHIRLEFHDIVIIETGESTKLQEMAARLCGVAMAPAARELPFLVMTGLADGVLSSSLTLVPYFRADGMTWLLALALGSVCLSVGGLVEIMGKTEQFFGLRLGVLGICLGLTPVAAMMWKGSL